MTQIFQDALFTANDTGETRCSPSSLEICGYLRHLRLLFLAHGLH